MRHRRATATLASLLALNLCACPQTATHLNFSTTAPAAPAGSQNVTWQNDGGSPTVNISAHVPLNNYLTPARSPPAPALPSCA